MNSWVEGFYFACNKGLPACMCVCMCFSVDRHIRKQSKNGCHLREIQTFQLRMSQGMPFFQQWLTTRKRPRRSRGARQTTDIGTIYSLVKDGKVRVRAWHAYIHKEMGRLWFKEYVDATRCIWRCLQQYSPVKPFPPLTHACRVKLPRYKWERDRDGELWDDDYCKSQRL